ncbi:MAG: methyltransferase domain-containing protein [Vicingaceae bacterium]
MFHFLLRTIPRPLLIKLSYVFNKVAPILFKGDKVEDPINGHTYSRFLPYGYGGIVKRKNALSPQTLSLERHRLLWLYLKNKTDFFEKERKMLHIAPEQCFYKLFRGMKNLDYTTADLNSPIADVKMDLHHAPFDDNSFDVIFCNHVLEHVEDDEQCMRELFRMLRPGGFAILKSPVDILRQETPEDPSIVSEDEREKHYWQKDHVRLFGLDYKDKLASAGFNVTVDNYIDSLSQTDVERYRVSSPQKDDAIYFCEK